MTVKNFLPKGFEPGPNHVIIGRGKQSYNHTGNLNLRKIVASRLEEYSATTTKKGKTQIISSIIEQIQTSKPEGTFLRHDKDHGYFVAGNFLSSDKISQTFRDLLRGNYKSSNTYKRNKRKLLKSQKLNTIQPSPTKSKAFDQFQFQQSFAHNFPSGQNTDLLSLMKNGRQNFFNRPRIEDRRSSMQFGLNQSVQSIQSIQSNQVDTTFLNGTLNSQTARNEENSNALKSIAFRRTSLGMNPLQGLSHIATNEDVLSAYSESNVVSSDESISDSSTVGTASKCDNDSNFDISICDDSESNNNLNGQWDVNLGHLETFYKKNGFDVVPSKSNPKQIILGKWIEEQRNDYLNFYEGRQTSMTAVQVVRLEKLGFSKYLRRD